MSSAHVPFIRAVQGFGKWAISKDAENKISISHTWHFRHTIPPPPPIPSLSRTIAARVSGRGLRSSSRAERHRRSLEAGPDSIQVCPPDWVDEIKTNTLYRKIQRQLSLVGADTEAIVTSSQ